MSGRKLIAVGIVQVLFAVLVLPYFDAQSSTEGLITEVAFIVFGSVVAVLGLLKEKGLLHPTLGASVSQRLPTNRRGRFGSAPQIFAAVMAVVAFVAVAEFLGLYLVTLPMPGRHPFFHRLAECRIIWAIFWTIVGWIFFLRRSEFSLSWRSWTIILIPFVVSIPDAANEPVIQSNRSNALPPGWIRMLLHASPLFPLVMGMILSGLLLLQLRTWIRLTRTGFCVGCGYNLRGNVSGICPECGKPIPDKQVPTSP